MRTAIIDALGYVAAFWAGLAALMAVGTLVMFTAARRGRPLRMQVRFFAPFLVMLLLYEGWLFGLPAATILMLIGFGLVSMVVLEWRFRFMEQHLETMRKATARREDLDGDGHA